MRVIETARFALEPQIAAHAEEMFVVLSDPAIYEYENQPPPSLEWLRTRFTKLETRLSADGREQWLNWVIRVPTSELVGYVQATVRPGGQAAIAYELCSAYWGRGLGRGAVQAMISELVQHYKVHSLFAVLKRDNLRSVRLLERLGFSLASPEQHVAHKAEDGEVLMCHESGTRDNDFMAPTFRPLTAEDLLMLHEWLQRPHIRQWWREPTTIAELRHNYLPPTFEESSTRAYIAFLEDVPIGFIQSYVVMGSGDGWWEDETDPGARGIDQFLANAEQLGQGLGSAVVRAFVEQLFRNPRVTTVQTDPSPENERAIRCYRRAGFVALRMVSTPDGPALLMRTERSNHDFFGQRAA